MDQNEQAKGGGKRRKLICATVTRIDYFRLSELLQLGESWWVLLGPMECSSSSAREGGRKRDGIYTHTHTHTQEEDPKTPAGPFFFFIFLGFVGKNLAVWEKKNSPQSSSNGYGASTTTVVNCHLTFCHVSKNDLPLLLSPRAHILPPLKKKKKGQLLGVQLGYSYKRVVFPTQTHVDVNKLARQIQKIPGNFELKKKCWLLNLIPKLRLCWV